MKGSTPFNSLRTQEGKTIVEPIVNYLDKDPNSGIETVKKLKVSDYNKVFPFETKEFSLEDLLAAGVPLTEVPTKIYNSTDPADNPYTQEQLLSEAEKIADKLNTEKETEE